MPQNSPPHLLSFAITTADVISPPHFPHHVHLPDIFLSFSFGTFPAGKRKSCRVFRTRPSPSGGAHSTARCDSRGRWPGSARKRVMNTSTVVRSAARSVHFVFCHRQPFLWKQSLFSVRCSNYCREIVRRQWVPQDSKAECAGMLPNRGEALK